MISIPPELLADPGPPLIIFLLVATIIVVGKWWRAAEAEVKVLVDKVSDQKLLNVQTTALVTAREFEREHYRRESEKCDKELDRCRYPSREAAT